MDGSKLSLSVSPFSGFSGVYTESVMDEIEAAVRVILDEKIGYLNDARERNYEIERSDWAAQQYPQLRAI